MTHEPYITLVYESYRKGQKQMSHIPSTFDLYHFSMLREYIKDEFSLQKIKSLPFEYDLEAIIDDWVLMVCFLGNDFIPAIPNEKQVLSISITNTEVFICGVCLLVSRCMLIWWPSIEIVPVDPLHII